MTFLPASISKFFQAEPVQQGIVIRISTEVVDTVKRVAPYAGTLLAAYAAPVVFAGAAAGGFFGATLLKGYNENIDKVFSEQALTIQILGAALSVVAIFLTPILTALYAGERAGCWARDRAMTAATG